MISPYYYAAAIAAEAVASIFFAALNYSLRDLSRVKFEQFLERSKKLRWLEPTLEYRGELIDTTAVARLVANTLITLTLFDAMRHALVSPTSAFWATAALSLMLTFFCSIALPHALAEAAGETLVGASVRPLHFIRKLLRPFSGIMSIVEHRVQNTVGLSDVSEPAQIEQEILSVVEEGEKEGIVDKQERVMIESVIEFHDTTAGEVMTPRAMIDSLPSDATLLEVREVMERSGHSRIPVYNGTLDQVVGVLHARDVLRQLGQSDERFDLRALSRPAFFIPESKLLSDLLRDFRAQKVHMAIVLDEYGGTAGLITIEDMLKELIGEISDEHEPHEAPMFSRVNDMVSEADARLKIDEFNQLAGLSLPEDAGYETIGGFISTTLGAIPARGASLEHSGARFTVLDAEPQKVNRVRIELLPVGTGMGAQAAR